MLIQPRRLVAGVFAAFAAVSLTLAPLSPAVAQVASYNAVRSGDAVMDKNFYLLTLLQADARAKAALAADADLEKVRQNLSATLQRALATCTSSDCMINAMILSDRDVGTVGDALARLTRGPLAPLVREHMRPSGRFQLIAGEDDAALMRAAWIETAAGVNRLYRVYGLGQPPRYPAIDAMSYKPGDDDFRLGLRAVLETASDDFDRVPRFLEPWSQVGLDLLVLNQRDEAGRFEPLVAGENQLATRRASRLEWSRFAHAAIVVPGAGPGEQERGLSAIGALRLRTAVRRYRAGLAPFILVSGGAVHPNKTPYNEAIEMKRHLVSRYGVPEDAIFVDPHARHTTTNLRNAVRILFYAGAPQGLSVLVTTSQSQSAYIESSVFSVRCRDELGFQPMALLRRVSPFDLAMSLNIDSLHADSSDPLDP